MAKTNVENDSNAINIIGVGTEITGDVNTNGDIRIDGFLSGNVVTEGKLVVGETGKIKGEVHCKNSEVLGMVEGKIKVRELVTLKSSARIYGDIVTQKLSIEPGSLFTGNCNMNEDAVKDVKTGKKSEGQTFFKDSKESKGSKDTKDPGQEKSS
ncbi:MAG: polymer-forming cytoskeletal protein [Bacteroidales bacterium]|nr:polymer-forming cytoskeletal protein [Bacteroidales bacterium]